MSDFIKVSSLIYAGKSSDNKPKGVDALTECWEIDTSAKWITFDGWNWNLKRYDGPNMAFKTSTSPLTTGTLFNYKGTISIKNIVGRVISAVQAQACTVKLGVVADLLSAYDICGVSGSITGYHVGALFTITGTAATGMVSTDSVGTMAPAQALPVITTCISSGIIKVTYSAANTGSILWMCQWEPISIDGVLYSA